MYQTRTAPAPGAHLKRMIEVFEEIYMDPPGSDAGEDVHRYHRDLHKLLGVATALVASLEITRSADEPSTAD